MSLPVIDFSTTANAKQVFERSLIDLGFSQIKNFDIDQALLEKVFAASLDFFTGDESTKHRCVYQSTHCGNGGFLQVDSL